MSIDVKKSKIICELIYNVKSIEQLRLELSFIGKSLHDEDVIAQIGKVYVNDSLAYRCLISNGKPVLLSDQGDELDDSAWKAFHGVYQYAFYDVHSLKEFPFEKCPNLKHIDIAAFKNTGLTAAVIPDSCTCIKTSAFVDCVFLKKVVIPSTVKTIDSFAFCHCCQLEDLALNEGLEVIGPNAFTRAISLQGKTIRIPDSCRRIGAYAFSGIRELHISLPCSCYVCTDAFPADARVSYRPDMFF